MFISFSRFQRNSLTKAQKEFLHVLVPFGRMVQEFTKKKCLLARVQSRYGIKASVVCADAIIKSDWGAHKVAKKYNNLNLLIADDYWYGKSKDFEDRDYRVYECWFDYAADLSDYYVFSGNFLSVLLSKNLDEQIDSLALASLQTDTYHDRMYEIITSLGLSEFDL